VNYPEESIQHSEHGESLKSRIIHLCGAETATHIQLFENSESRKIQTLGKYPEESIQQEKC
jgi:hypothetical protein